MKMSEDSSARVLAFRRRIRRLLEMPTSTRTLSRMSERSLLRLLALRRHVQRSLEVVRANEPFRLPDGQQKSAWKDLHKVTLVLGCRKQGRYPRYTYMRAVAGALESTMEAFMGKEALPDLQHIRRYLATVLEKTTGKYEYEHQIALLFFLGRFRNKLTNRIAAAQKAARKKKA